jgi:hypothetical protein
MRVGASHSVWQLCCHKADHQILADPVVPLMAHRVISLPCDNLVALGTRRKSDELRLQNQVMSTPSRVTCRANQFDRLVSSRATHGLRMGRHQAAWRGPSNSVFGTKRTSTCSNPDESVKNNPKLTSIARSLIFCWQALNWLRMKRCFTSGWACSWPFELRRPAG